MAANNNHFSLTLDTLAPVGSISRGSVLAHNANFALTIDKGDAQFMRIWFDTTASPSAIPTSGVELIPAATSYQTKFSTDGTYYYHVVLEDDLGNQSAIYNTAAIQYDITIPVVTKDSVEICLRDGTATEVTTTRDVAVKAEFSDELSGCVSYRITGEIVGSIVEGSADYAVGVAYAKDDLIKHNDVGYAVYEAITDAENTSFDAIKSKLILWATISGDLTSKEIEDGNMKKDITLSGSGEEESTKVVYVTVTDAAGNVAAPEHDTIYLDTKFLTGAIILKDITGTTTLNDNWTNEALLKVMLQLNVSADVVGYKIWGDINTDNSSTGTTEPTDFIAVAKGTNPIDAQIYVASVNYAKSTAYALGDVVKYNYELYKATEAITAAENTGWDAISAKMDRMDVNFTSGDAENKTVNAKVIDSSGNITTLTAVSADVDYTAPTLSVVCDVTYVSLQTGFNQAVFTPTCDATISGAHGYQWYCNGTEWPQAKGGSGLGAPEALTVAAADLGEGGAKVTKAFTLTVTDNAGNSVTSDSVTIYLDTVAPTGTITMDAWYNRDDADQTTYKKFSAAGATASATDGGAGVTLMTCWCSQVANDSTVVGTQIEYSANPTHDKIDWTGKTESSTNYIHIEYVDAVGNKAIAHSAAFGIDLTVPANGTVTFTKDVYNTTSAAANLTYSDTLSGVAKFKIWGDISEAATEQAATWQDIAASKNLTLTGEDGTKTVNVKYQDLAGNISVNTVSDTAELDRAVPGALLELRKPDDSAAKEAHSSVAEFAAHVAGLDDYVAYSYVPTVVYATKTAYFVGANLSNTVSSTTKYYKVDTAITASENTSFAAISDKLTEVSGVKYAEGSYIVNLAAHNHTVYQSTSDITYAENTSFDAISAKLSEETGLGAAVQYKLYGDFTYTEQAAQGITEANAQWKQLVYISGQAYMLIPDGATPAGESSAKMFCTSGDGLKNIYLKVKDNAENVSAAVLQSFFYDTTAPEVTVSGVDYNRISKVHTARLTTSEGSVVPVSPEKFNDETKFTFTPNSVIQAYKVVAYVSQAAAKAGSAADDPIKQAGDEGTDPVPASINMHATGLSSDAAVNATIKGADYEARLLAAYNTSGWTQKEAEDYGYTFEDGTVNGIDGAHYVVVYVQDLAGTWSQNAIFEV